MKKLSVILFLFCLRAASQSFSASINPTALTIQQGQTANYSITYTTTGGYNASIFLQMIVPTCLNSSISLSATSINSPYPAVSILVNNTATIPPGTHNLILKSYNGSLVKYDTCKLTVAIASPPSWFKYNRPDFPLYDVVVEKSLCIKNKIWFFSMCCSWGSPGGTAIMSFDDINWECWYQGNKHFVTDVCGDTLLKNNVPTLSSAFNIRDMAKFGTDVYFITIQEIIKIDSLSGFSFITPPAGLDMWTNGLYRIRVDNNGKIWLKSLNFLYYQDNSNNWQQFSFSGANFGITDIDDFEFDSANNIWFLTSTGMNMFNGTFWSNYNNSNSNLPGLSSTYQIGKDRLGNIYAFNHQALFKFTGTSNWLVTTFDSFNASQAAYTIGFDSYNAAHIGLANSYYIQNSSGFTKFTNNNCPLFTQNGFPVSIDFDNNDNVVIGDANGGIVRFGPLSLFAGTGDYSLTDADILIYPNPTTDKMNVELKENVNLFEVVDLSGRVIICETLETNKIEINLVNLDNGVYIVKLHGKNRFATKKIIKQ